jgi:serine phosphatase RsbU (regulator of sigma subunit)
MRELDPAVQLTLAVAALRGQRFTPGELAAVLHVPTVAVETHLQTACAEGLVVRELAAADAPAASSPETGVHRFVHDRIVEACQGLLETPERLRLSLALARHLTASTATVPLRRSGEDLFAALHHFNAARELVDDPRERLALARLNLEGGRRADASAAWDIGRDLYEMGLAFLPEDAWTTERQLTRELHYGAGASAMLAGEHAKAEQRFAALMDDARTAVEKAEISFFCCRLYIAMTLNREAIAVGMQGLEALGIRVRGKRPTEARAFVTALATKERLLRWSDERLLGLPPMRDERMILGMRLLTELIHAALVVHHELGIILTCLQIRLLMRHGHSPYSAFPFLYLGIVINGGSVYLGTPLWRQDQMQRLLALYRQLDARWTDPHLRSRGAFSHAMFMAHWEPGFRSVVTRLHELTRGFIDRGDAVYTGYGMIISLDTGLLTGHNLIAQLQSSEPWSEVSKQYQNALGQKSWSMQRDSNEALINGTAAEALRYAEQLDPEQVKSPEELGHYVGGLMQKGLIQTLYGDFSEASRALIKAALAGVVRTFAGNYKTASFHLLLCLALARSLEATPPWKKPLHYLLLFWSRRVLGVFARMAPEPFAQKRTLADALWALVRRRPRAQVHALLEEAARQSRDHGYPGDEALACELLGRLLLEQQTPRMAVGPLRSARRAYERWGLLAKVRELDELMGGLPEAADLAVSLRAEQTHATTTTSKQQSSLLDGPTLTRATHALSREINLEELKRTLMQLLRENAGARRAVLVWRGGEPDGEAPARVEAHVDPDGSPSTTSLPLTNDRLSIRAWTYVQRTKTTLIVGDVRGTDPWCDDQALKERGCRAMLCMPILKGGALKGAIYLENDLLAHAFSEERVEVLSVLAGQLAISLDNALLYEQLLSSLTKEREARAKEQTSHAEYIKAEAARRELQAGLEAAEAVQKSLLVTAPPTPLFELASLYAPAERAGGDWLSSYHDESHGFLYLFLGDVTGHGISSALVTAAVAGAAASAIDAIERQTTPNLAAALDQIGLAMNAAVRRTGHPTGRLMTMALIGIDLQSGRGHYRNAGQTPVLWFQGHETHAILDGGSPLGMHAGGRFGQRSFQLTPGDRLILYSDGLIENRLPGAAPAGRKLLKEIGSSTPSPHEALSQIRAYVDSFVADAKRDDVACIAFRYLGPEPMAVVKGAVGGC